MVVLLFKSIVHTSDVLELTNVKGGTEQGGVI